MVYKPMQWQQQDSGPMVTGREGNALSVAESVSAAMDSEADLAPLSAEARADWSTYHIIGDVLKSDEMAGFAALTSMQDTRHATGCDFATRFAARLAAEPTVIAPAALPAALSPGGMRGTPQRAKSGFAVPAGIGRWLGGNRLPSFAAAAAVATLAWVLVPGTHVPRAGTSAAATSTLVSLDVPTSPREGWQRVNLSADAALNPYLMAHQQFASDRGDSAYIAYAGLDKSGH